jgi:hypothetical protein
MRVMRKTFHARPSSSSLKPSRACLSRAAMQMFFQGIAGENRARVLEIAAPRGSR